MRTEAERLLHYRAAFLEKVKKWRWEEPNEESYNRRGRKPKSSIRIEARPRTKGEELAFINQK
jgi:hypothetical protein